MHMWLSYRIRGAKYTSQTNRKLFAKILELNTSFECGEIVISVNHVKTSSFKMEMAKLSVIIIH